MYTYCTFVHILYAYRGSETTGLPAICRWILSLAGGFQNPPATLAGKKMTGQIRVDKKSKTVDLKWVLKKLNAVDSHIRRAYPCVLLIIVVKSKNAIIRS